MTRNEFDANQALAARADSWIRRDYTIRGEYRSDGSFIGYDYTRQQFIDTAPNCVRDPAALPGSARNPLAAIPI